MCQRVSAIKNNLVPKHFQRVSVIWWTCSRSSGAEREKEREGERYREGEREGEMGEGAQEAHYARPGN